MRAQGGCEGAEGVAGREFVINQHQALRGIEQTALGRQVQPLLRGVAVAFFEGAGVGAFDAQAAGVQVERRRGRVGGKPGFKDALRQCGRRFRHADEKHGGRQVGGQFRGKQAMHTGEGRGRHRDVFAQHFADEEEGAARVGAGAYGKEFVGRQVGAVNGEGQAAIGQVVNVAHGGAGQGGNRAGIISVAPGQNCYNRPAFRTCNSS